MPDNRCGPRKTDGPSNRLALKRTEFVFSGILDSNAEWHSTHSSSVLRDHWPLFTLIANDFPVHGIMSSLNDRSNLPLFQCAFLLYQLGRLCVVTNCLCPQLIETSLMSNKCTNDTSEVVNSCSNTFVDDFATYTVGITRLLRSFWGHSSLTGYCNKMVFLTSEHDVQSMIRFAVSTSHLPLKNVQAVYIYFILVKNHYQCTSIAP